uniref:Uncharacterized protein n=1 Tax=Phlebotomus papatasi TaxID=29031 RepID=A0A1B0D0Z5_PHLPP
MRDLEEENVQPSNSGFKEAMRSFQEQLSERESNLMSIETQKFKLFPRMSIKQFDFLAKKNRSRIAKTTGDSFPTLSNEYLTDISTISEIVNEFKDKANKRLLKKMYDPLTTKDSQDCILFLLLKALILLDPRP